MSGRAIKVYCPNGHPVDRICTIKTCPHPAAVCIKLGCKYSEDHKKCTSTTDAKDLANMFEQKGSSFTKEVDEVFINSINEMINGLEMLKKEYLEKGRYSFELTNDNRKVYELLKNGPAMDLKPRDVNGLI